MAFTLKEGEDVLDSKVESVSEPERELERISLFLKDKGKPLASDTQYYYILIVYTLLVTKPRRHESDTRSTEDMSDEKRREVQLKKEPKRHGRSVGGGMLKRSARLKVSFRRPKSKLSVTQWT